MAQKTIYDIAKIVGCSAGTVSRAINNRPGVSEKTKAIIQAVIRKENYHTNAIAKSLVSQQTHTIALIIPDISESLLSSITSYADQALSGQNYNIILYNTYWNPDIELQKIKFAVEKQVDGIILKPSSENIDYVKQLDIPCVLISHTSRENVCCIDIENESAGYNVVKHLLSHGFDKIAFIGGSEYSTSIQLRLNGYKSALAENNIDICSDWIWYGDFSFENGYKAMEHMLQLSERPNAFFCCSDSTAIGIYQKAIEAGLSVPADCGIVGFNNDQITSFPLIGLTTVNQPTKEMGEAAARILIDMIENGNRQHNQKLMLYPEVIVRSTT